MVSLSGRKPPSRRARWAAIIFLILTGIAFTYGFIFPAYHNWFGTSPGISDYTNLQKLDFCRNDGKEVYDLLTSLGYEISDENKLIGKASGSKVKDTIYDFFDDKTDNPDDTFLLRGLYLALLSAPA